MEAGGGVDAGYDDTAPATGTRSAIQCSHVLAGCGRPGQQFVDGDAAEGNDVLRTVLAEESLKGRAFGGDLLGGGLFGSGLWGVRVVSSRPNRYGIAQEHLRPVEVDLVEPSVEGQTGRADERMAAADRATLATGPPLLALAVASDLLLVFGPTGRLGSNPGGGAGIAAR